MRSLSRPTTFSLRARRQNPFEVLEERVLFDGVPDAPSLVNLDAAHGPIEATNLDTNSRSQSEQQAPLNLVIVDPGVESASTLLSELLSESDDGQWEIHHLSASQDGIEQITRLLESSGNEYRSLHIISHGQAGAVRLGDATLSSTTLNRYADSLASWSDTLDRGADILFYGCDLAGNASGESLLHSLSALTGADVAASSDATGSSDLGGDWDLEFTVGTVETDSLAAFGYHQILALADATLSITSDGTPTWDPNNDPGNDTDGANGIIRSHDSILMEVFYNTDAGGATDLHFTSTLPEGLVWDLLPAAAALDPRSMIVDSVTGLEGGDMRSIIAYLPDVSGTFTSSVNFEARALGNENGTALNGVTFEANSNENATAIQTMSYDFVLSSAANMDIRLLSPTFRGVHTDATGTVDGVVYSYGIGIFGAHPTRTGSDGVKGAAPIEDSFTFDLDLSQVTPGATIFDWGATLGTTTENATDGINRNYERFVNSAGSTVTAWSQSNRPSGQTGEAGSAAWSEERSTPDSGDWTISGSAGSVYSVEVSGADTSGSHFPERRGGGGVLPASEKWFTSAQVHVWIPIDEILPGEDGISGTDDDGVLNITPEITNFDPDDFWGVTNNFGTGIEDTTNNDYTHTVSAASLGGSTKYNSEAGHPTSGRWVSSSTQWASGDGETSIGHQYDARVSSGRNQGVLPLEGLIFGDKFDNTATRIVANSLPAQSGDGWSRGYSSGGPFTGTHLTYGVDYIIEFGTGGVGGDPAGWTDWNSMGDATLADGETSTVWSQDPTDPNLGGNAYADGVRDSITKWRVTMLRDLEPGENVLILVTMETLGHSTLDLANNPGGNIIANFNAQSAQFLRDNPNPDDDWRTSEYNPLTNGWYSEGSSGHLYRGDRLWIVDANVDVDKTVVDLGAGNNFLAGSAATIQLEGTVTIPGPDSGAPAQDVYITDMLPAGLTVVGGSAQPPAGYAFTAGDGSTISVQSVEYFDPNTSNWSTEWSYGATGIRWYYGDVPLNTQLPTMTFDVLIPYDADNGESWTNTAVASSPSDDTTEEFRSSSAGLVAVQVAAMAAGKFVVTPLVPEDTTITYELGIANVSNDKDVPWFDLVDVLPYDGDFEGSSFSGIFNYIDVSGLAPGLEVYVTSTAATTLDAQDGTVDGYGDPGTPSDTWYVAEGTGIWTYTLADVQNGIVGAPTMDQITAIRVVSDKGINPYLAAGESTSFFLHLTPQGNVGIPSDHYTNKFTARTDPGQLPLPVTSAAVTAVVVAPDIEIQKQVAIDETHTNIDPTNDAHWAESVSFDDTDKAYFRVEVTNTGTADFLGVTVNDTLPPGATIVGGTAMASTGDLSGFPATWTFDLGAGDSAWLIYQVDVNDAGNYPNTADVSATDAWGENVVDSDDAEANFTTEIAAAKQQVSAVRSTSNPAHFEVTYEVEILNTSIFDLANLSLTENLLSAFGAGFTGMVTSPAITATNLSAGATVPTVNNGFNGSTDGEILNNDGLLKPGDSITLRYTVSVDPSLLPDPANTVNQVLASGVTEGVGGTPVSDLSDDGSDPATSNSGSRGDSGGTDDPTPLALPSIDLTKEIVGAPVPAISGVNGNYDVTYEFTIENTGTVDLDNVAMVENFLANMGGAFVAVVNGPLVTFSDATDSPDFNSAYDGGATDANVFAVTPTTTSFHFGGNPTSTTLSKETVFGDEYYVIDPNQTYTLSVDAFAGDGAGGNFVAGARHYLGFASYDVDGRLITPYEYQRSPGAVDTTLAAPLNPGDTTITLTDATGWHNGSTSHRRSIAWYGYTDSTGYTYADYTYTRNVEIAAWDAGGISGNTITLNSPWAGPALSAGDAVRNSTSGGNYQYVLLGGAEIDEAGGTFTSPIGGGYIPDGAGATTLWRPGTHSIRALALTDYDNDGVQLNLSNFEIAAPNASLIEPGQTVTFQMTVEIDPDSPTAIYDGITGDGNNSLENNASISAQDPWNSAVVTDVSDDPTDPTQAEYGSDSDPDDPTSLSIADIELTKELIGTPVAASSGTFGNFDATYEFTVTNQGNDALSMLSLVEDLRGQFGGAFVRVVPQAGAPASIVSSSATDGVEINLGFNGDSDTELFDNLGGNTNLLETGQSIIVQLVVEIDPDAPTANYVGGQLLNIAMTAGTGAVSGARVDDESDDVNDSTNTDTDSDNSPQDPTPLYIPSISLTKSAADAVANGDNWDVTFTKVVKNTGTATLDNLQLLDDIASQFGNAFVSISGLAIQNFSGTGTAPSANAAWQSDTTQNMLSGGEINLGDRFEVVFTVTIDPDGIDSVSQALENQSMISGDALDADGNALLDDMGTPIVATDDSDNGLDPDSENGEDNADGTPANDPTPIVIADVGVAKRVIGQPTWLSNGNYSATYELVVENTGTVDLANLSLVEDISSQFGTAFVSATSLTLTSPPANAASTITLDSGNWDGDGVTEMVNSAVASRLAVGDSFVVQFDVELDPDASGTASAPLENQVIASGTAVDSTGTTLVDGSGQPIVANDLSDSGNDPSTTNGGDLGDHGTSDDPTPIYIPSISIAKSAGDAVANGDEWDVPFVLTIENTGTVDLNNLNLQDDIAARFGNSFVSASNLTLQNFSGTGTAPGVNGGWTGNTTLNMLDGTGQLNVGDSFEIAFTITIDPDGIDSIASPLENQASITGDALDESGNPIDDGLGGTLQATDESDNGLDPNSENGEDNADGVFANDPTPVYIADIAVAKQVVGAAVPVGENFQVTYQLVIENTGTTSLESLSLQDDVAAQFGPTFISASGLSLVSGPSDINSSVALDSANWDGDTVFEMINSAVPSRLEVGDSFVVQFTVTVDPDATGTSSPLENSVEATGDAIDSNGNTILDSTGSTLTASDDSDSGTDPSTNNGSAPGDTGGTDDPTPLQIADLGVGKQANSVTNATDGAGNELNGVFDVQYLVVIENTGTVALNNLQLIDDLTATSTFGDAYDASPLSAPTDRSGLVTGPAIVSHTLANSANLPTLNAGFTGGGAQTTLFDGSSGILDPGEQIVVSFTIRVDALELTDGDTLDGAAQNQVTGTADSVVGAANDLSDDGLNPNSDNGSGTAADPTPLEVPQVRIWKQHGDARNNGDGTSTIAVTLRIENAGTVELTNLSLSEDIASQFGNAFISATVPTLNVSGAPGSTIPSSLINSGWNTNTSLDMFDASVTTERLLVGEEFEITFDVVVDPDLMDNNSQYLQNLASVQADGQNYDGSTVRVSDDSAIDNGSGIDADEATPAIVPEIGLAKSAGDAVANGENWDVTFTIAVENTGSVNLDQLNLVDDIAAEFGDAFVSVSGLAVQNSSGAGTAPTANTAWESNTTLNMLSGGELLPSDHFEVVFTVTLDPDGVDSISQALDNQATVTGRGIDATGNPFTDGSGNTLTATDQSDSGTQVQGTNPTANGDNSTDDDPTPVVIADLGLAKSVVGQPVLLANGNFAATYQLVVENTGTVDLANLSLIDDIQTQFGASVFSGVSGLSIATAPTNSASSVTLNSSGWDGTASTDMVDQSVTTNLLKVGDSLTLQFTVELNSSAASGLLTNSVTAEGTAVDPSGTPYQDAGGNDILATDTSDSGTDASTSNTGAPGDQGNYDDPTPLYVPSLGLAKQAGDAVANGDNWDVTFTLTWENTGTVALTNLQLFDDVAAQFGSEFVSVSGLAVQNFSGAGTAPVANAAWLSDTTQSLISGGTAQVDDSFEVIFTVTLDPDATGTSSDSLNNQATSTGEALDENGIALTDASGGPITASDSSDDGVDPTSENGQDSTPDGVFANDPTPIIVADISVAKAAVGTPVELPDGNFTVVYELVVENTGTVDLASLSLVEELSSHFGTAWISSSGLTLSSAPTNLRSSITLDSANWNGDTIVEMIDQSASNALAVGDSFSVQFSVIVDPDAAGAPATLENQVTVGGDAVDSLGNAITDSGGTPIVASDDSDSGSNPNTDNPGAQGDSGTGSTDDPTPLLIPDIAVVKAAGDAMANGDYWDVTFSLLVKNIGTVALQNLSLIDDLSSEFGNALLATTPITIQNFIGTGTPPTANPNWPTDSTQNMLLGGVLDAGDSFEVSFTLTLDPDAVDSVSEHLDNQAIATGEGVNPDGTAMLDGSGNPVTTIDASDNGTDPQGENSEDNGDGIAANDPTPVIIADLGIAKSVVGQPTLLANGNFTVTYRVAVENTGTVDIADLSLTEDLGAHFGSGFVDVNRIAIASPPSALNSTVDVNQNWDGSTDSELLDTSSASLLEVGDAFVIEFEIEVDARELGSNTTVNSVIASGNAVDDSGTPLTDSLSNPITVSDLSDSGTDPSTSNIGEPGDTFGSDDPTPLYIPSLGLAKHAGDAVENGANWDVPFVLTIENNGSVTLRNLQLHDDMAAQFGNALQSITDVRIENFAGTGTPPTINNAWTGDTTQSILSGGELAVGDRFEVHFTVTVDPNAGGSSQSLDNQATVTGDAIDEKDQPILDSTGSPVSTTDVSDDGVATNDENGEEVTTDGIYANDPTPIHIADLAIAKSTVGDVEVYWDGTAVVTYQLVVENTGTVDLANLSLIDDLATHFGSVFRDAGDLRLTAGPSDAGSSIQLDSAGWNGSTAVEMLDQSRNNTLAIGDQFTLQFTVEVDALSLKDTLYNQADGIGEAVDNAGVQLTTLTGAPLTAEDASDNGLLPRSENGEDNLDGIYGNDPTPATAEIDPTGYLYDADTGLILTGGGITVTGPTPGSVNLIDDGSDGFYQFFGTDNGTYVITVTAPPGYYLDTTLLNSGQFDPTGLPAPVLLGSNDADANGQLDNTTPTEYYFEFDLNSGDPAVFFNNLPFRRLLEGTTGNPPRLPFLGPVRTTPLSSLIGSYLGGPGTIYSGQPIQSNGAPLSLDSDRPVSGGYSLADPCGNVDQPLLQCPVQECLIPDPCDPCNDQPAVELPPAEFMSIDCGCDTQASTTHSESNHVQLDAADAGEQTDEADEISIGYDFVPSVKSTAYESATTEIDSMADTEVEETDDDSAHELASPHFLSKLFGWLLTR